MEKNGLEDTGYGTGCGHIHTKNAWADNAGSSAGGILYADGAGADGILYANGAGGAVLDGGKLNAGYCVYDGTGGKNA